MWIKDQHNHLYNSDQLISIYAEDSFVKAEQNTPRYREVYTDGMIVYTPQEVHLGIYGSDAAANEEIKNIFRSIKDNNAYYVMRTPRAEQETTRQPEERYEGAGRRYA